MVYFISSVLFFGFWLCSCHAASGCWRDTACTGPLEAAFNGPWDSYIYAPSSRSVVPASIVSNDGKYVETYTGNFSISGNRSRTVLDFGTEVGGIIHLDWKSSGSGRLGLAFTEAANWIGYASDNSHSGASDGAIYANLTQGSGSYVMPDIVLRGGFRYLTLFLDGNITAIVSNITLEISFQPTWSNLKAYQGYFYSNDEVLNKVWYSGAYTLQTNIVPPNTGGGTPIYPEFPWAENGILGNGTTILVDGAKRDRLVWPGDMGVAVPSLYVSIGEIDSVRNALQTMYDHQNSDGSLPEAGPPYLAQGSDTYHMWTMIGTYNYVLYTFDNDWLSEVWPKYQKAMDYIYAKVDLSGLLYVTGTKDWARQTQGGYNTQANMILYRTLITASSLAMWANDTTGLSATYLERAASLRGAINTHCWSTTAGAFKDNASSTTLIPQDANSMAILYGVVNSTQAQSISTQLTTNWNAIGAVSPELPGNIVTFISSLEVQAHFIADQPARALELIRRSWGWYLNNTSGTQSTVIEGYRADGTFGYRYNRGYKDASYTSHSHGWSSGPTSALTEYVLGLSVIGRIGRTWGLKPHFGDLKSVQGGFRTLKGKFHASWTIDGGSGYSVNVSTPTGTTGNIVLPALNGSTAVVMVNGKEMKYSLMDGGLSFTVKGGTYTINVDIS